MHINGKKSKIFKQSIKKYILPYVLKAIPARILRNTTQPTPAIFYYHMISDNDVQHVKNIFSYKNIQEFRSDIDFLLNYFKPVDLFDLLDALDGKRKLPSNSFLLTFDDGFSEMYNIVRPILLEKGISATFFINKSFIDNKQMCYLQKASLIIEHIKKKAIRKTQMNKINEILSVNKSEIGWPRITTIDYQQKHLLDEISRILTIDFDAYLSCEKPYLTSGQIWELISDGFTIGAHSIDHPLYENLSLNEQLRQTIESVMFVKEKFSLNYGAFAFPHKDDGVSKHFFSEINNNGLVDVSFGTGGLLTDEIHRNFQRLSLENPPKPAEYHVAYSCLRKIYWSFLGKKQITRFEE